MSAPQIDLVDVQDASRFEAHLDGELAGFLDYRLAGNRRILIHTEVLPVFAGRGVGAALARHALAEARSAGRRVTVRCPFIHAYLLRHPDQADVVIPEVIRKIPG